MKLAVLLNGISYCENYNNHYMGNISINFNLSYFNYKNIIYEYFEKIGYSIDTFISTNIIDNDTKKKELIELYNPVKYCFVDNLKGNNYINSNYKIIKNIEQMKQYSTINNITYDYILITRFDLYFNINFECINFDYNMINVVSQLEHPNLICDNFYFFHNRFINKLYNIIKNDKSMFRHGIKNMLNNKIHFLYNEPGRLVSELSFYHIVRYYKKNIIIPDRINKNICEINITNNSVLINKINSNISSYSWFGYQLEKGIYIVSFEFKIDKILDVHDLYNMGFKTHNPDIYYNEFLLNKQPNKIYQTILRINNINNGLFIFILDFCKKIKIEFFNLEIYKYKH